MSASILRILLSLTHNILIFCHLIDKPWSLNFTSIKDYTPGITPQKCEQNDIFRHAGWDIFPNDKEQNKPYLKQRKKMIKKQSFNVTD